MCFCIYLVLAFSFVVYYIMIFLIVQICFYIVILLMVKNIVPYRGTAAPAPRFFTVRGSMIVFFPGYAMVSDQKPKVKAAAGALPQQREKENAISDKLEQKIIKQVEYQFSDMCLLANESFVKHVNKDPEDFVPMNIISSTKKLKSLNACQPPNHGRSSPVLFETDCKP